jgi:hypothetical protein
MDCAVTAERTTKESAADTASLACYGTAHGHLIDLLLRHDWLLQRYIARSGPRKPDDILGFAAISRQEVERHLGHSADCAESAAAVLAIDETLQDLERLIDEKVKRSRAQGMRLPLVELARRFALGAREIDLLFVAVAVEIDRRYERVYGFLHDDMSRKLPSPALALGLYCENVADQLEMRELLSSQSALRHYRLIEVVDDGAALPWLSRSMRVDARILGFLLGESAIDARVSRSVTWMAGGVESASQNLPPRAAVEELIEQLSSWSGDAQSRGKPLIYLQGPQQAGAEALVGAAARRLGLQVLAVDCEALLEGGVDFEQALFLAFREGLLRQAPLFLRNVDRVLDGPAGEMRCRALLRCVGDMGSVVIASGERAWGWQLPAEPVSLRIVEFHPGGFDDQLQAWQALSKGRFEQAQLHHLVSLHPMPVAAIGNVWRMAQVLAGADCAAEPLPSLTHVQQACRAQSGTPVSSLARRIEPKHGWQDLVLPKPQYEQLLSICSQAKHASIVYGAGRFDRKLSLGRGLNALFSGPPGTGKTMAAEVIAAELGVQMLKIDLSQIVSKYIGETEKNLRQLFDQAASANAILFFDEADALLGKRSDVKDAHDRYANTETAYLLQKMEEYPGITVLATNLRQNMDEAFTRRMRFIVDFPFPEDEDRLRIWRSVWPPEVPLAEDVDLPTLARQFRFAGGSIRNVALSAAFLAAEQQQPVTMRHLIQATKRELRKMGRLVNEDEYRRYG